MHCGKNMKELAAATETLQGHLLELWMPSMAPASMSIEMRENKKESSILGLYGHGFLAWQNADWMRWWSFRSSFRVTFLLRFCRRLRRGSDGTTLKVSISRCRWTPKKHSESGCKNIQSVWLQILSSIATQMYSYVRPANVGKYRTGLELKINKFRGGVLILLRS